ncbi:MAG: hypothetical protein CM1200mP10_13680 [Candidatus Neomarinimicrobiota bacterium]|nr:MAG: hypothetical protein CM1200mP10_13680 [Candidatus Neomarinimicrobiota bacterium]
MLDRNTENKNNTVDTKLSRFEVYDNLFPSRQEGLMPGYQLCAVATNSVLCVVPFTRGRERSRSRASIVNEVKKQ